MGTNHRAAIGIRLGVLCRFTSPPYTNTMCPNVTGKETLDREGTPKLLRVPTRPLGVHCACRPPETFECVGDWSFLHFRAQVSSSRALGRL